MSIIKIKKEEQCNYDIVMIYFFFVNNKNISGMLVL